MVQTTGVPGRGGRSRGLLAALLFVLAYLIARIVLEAGGLAGTLRVMAALLPAAPFVWMLWEIIRGVRAMDELERRIHLEALAVAFPLAMILLMILGLLELAIPLPPEDLSYRHVWAMLPLLFFAGLAIARRRYA